MKTLVDIQANPADFGNGGGDIINSGDVAVHGGPYYILIAKGGDAVIATGSVPDSWKGAGSAGAIDGTILSAGEPLVLPGMSNITFSSIAGKVYAYKMQP